MTGDIDEFDNHVYDMIEKTKMLGFINISTEEKQNLLKGSTDEMLQVINTINNRLTK